MLWVDNTCVIIGHRMYILDRVVKEMTGTGVLLNCRRGLKTLNIGAHSIIGDRQIAPKDHLWAKIGSRIHIMSPCMNNVDS